MIYSKPKKGDLINIKTNHSKSKEIIHSQWKIVTTIENKYHGKIVQGTTSKFEDNLWQDEKDKIYWNTYISDEYPILRLIIKCYAFEQKRIRKSGVSNIKTRCHYNIKELITTLIDHKILTATKGEYIVGLSALTEKTFLNALDLTIISVTRNIHSLIDKINSIYNFFKFTRFMMDNAPFLQNNIELPWEISNQSVKEWAEQRAMDISHYIKDSQGYTSLPPKTYYPIIEKSMYILNELEDIIISLHKLKLSSTKGTHNNISVRSLNHIDKKYSCAFNEIDMPAYYTTDNVLSVSWINDIIYLAKGACINIILLTTGLRSIDVRSLVLDCCQPSKHIDSLYYLSAKISKTSNFVHLPVPTQTYRAIRFLSNLKSTDNKYILDAGQRVHRTEETGKYSSKSGHIVNKMLRSFAKHFNIPYEWKDRDIEFVTHCYRSTVAGFLSESSNLAIIMIRRLFGYSNDIMPTFYQRNNPMFAAQQKEDHELAAKETASVIADATIEGKVAGSKGEDIKRGFSRFKQKSQSLTDKEIRQEFRQIIEDRIINGTTCGFLTPFGIICMRNPVDSKQPPCSKRSHKKIVKEIDIEIINYLSAIDPSNCIGAGCTEAMIGPWSTIIVKSLVEYKKLLKHQCGDSYKETHFIEHAKYFINTYEPLIKQVFGDNYE